MVRREGTGRRIAIRVKPGSSRTRVGGEFGDALVVAVTAPAVDGRASEAALQALATALGVRRRDLRLVTGATSRTKVVELADGVADVHDIGIRIARLRTGS